MATLHPLLVHFPISLILLWPVLDLIGLLTHRRQVQQVALGILLLAIPLALSATLTGQSAYEAAIAAGASPELLDTHADLAGVIPWLLLGLGALRGLGGWKLGRRAELGALVLGLALGAVIVWVGKTGGALVYQHGVGVVAR